MKKLLNDPDEGSPIIAFGETVFDLMMLNVMWFICSLLVVTMGAATTAMNYTCIKMQRDEGDSIVRMFFRSFGRNIRQALVLWTGMLCIFILLFTGLVHLSAYEGALSQLLWVVVILILLVWVVLFTYLFMVLCRFENTIRNTIVNSVYLILTHLKETFKMLIIDLMLLIALPYICFIYAPILVPMFIFFAVPGTAYYNASVFDEKIFNEFVPSGKENR